MYTYWCNTAGEGGLTLEGRVEGRVEGGDPPRSTGPPPREKSDSTVKLPFLNVSPLAVIERIRARANGSNGPREQEVAVKGGTWWGLEGGPDKPYDHHPGFQILPNKFSIGAKGSEEAFEVLTLSKSWPSPTKTLPPRSGKGKRFLEPLPDAPPSREGSGVEKRLPPLPRSPLPSQVTLLSDGIFYSPSLQRKLGSPPSPKADSGVSSAERSRTPFPRDHLDENEDWGEDRETSRLPSTGHVPPSPRHTPPSPMRPPADMLSADNVPLSKGSRSHSLGHMMLAQNGFISQPHSRPSEEQRLKGPSPFRVDFHGFENEEDFHQVPLAMQGDHDENEVTLSGTMRTKIALLNKRKEMMKKVEERRKMIEERQRKFRELEEEMGKLEQQKPKYPESRRNSLAPSKAQAGRSPSRSPQVPKKDSQVSTKSGAGTNATSLRARRSIPASRRTSHLSSTGSKGSLGSGASVNGCVFPEQMEPFADPKEGMRDALELLNMEDWELKVQGITDLVRLTRFHGQVLLGDLHNVNIALMKEVKNLRSQVSRAAIQAFGEFFEYLKRAMENDLERIVNLMLQKTGETNKFIQRDANKALDAMVDRVTPIKCVTVLISEGLAHKNPQVRASTSRLLANSVEAIGAHKVLTNKELTDRIIPSTVRLIGDGNPEARFHAKRTFRTLSDHPEFMNTLKRFVPANQLKGLEKTINSIKKSDFNTTVKFGTLSRLNRTL